MRNILAPLLLLILPFLCFSEEETNFSFKVKDPVKYKVNENDDLTCVGAKNQPKEIYIYFSSSEKQLVGNDTSEPEEIKDIEGGKLINKKDEKKEIPTLCYYKNSTFYCKAVLDEDVKIEPGDYYFSADEKPSGTPYLSIIEEFKSEITFPVVDKVYQKFPYDKEKTIKVEYVNGKFDIEIKYDEDIVEPLVMTQGDKKYECHVSEKDKKTLVCPITDKDFPPSEKGNDYSASFINVCEKEEGKVKIKAVTQATTSGKTSIIYTYVLPGVAILILIAVIVVIVVCVILKKKGDKELGEIMQTSYASEEEKKRQQQQESLAPETIV